MSKFITSECIIISKQNKPLTCLFSVKLCNVFARNSILFVEFTSYLKFLFFETQTKELATFIGKFYAKMRMKMAKPDFSIYVRFFISFLLLIYFLQI